MAIAFDTVGGANGVAVASLTFSMTIAAGSVVAVFAAELGDTPTVSTVKWNTSETLTAVLGTTDLSGGVQATNGLWMLHNPTSGTHNVVVTFSAAGGAYCAACGLSYTGVANASVAAMHRTVYSAPGASGGGYDLTVTDSQSGDQVIASCGDWRGSAIVLSAGAGMTSRRVDSLIGGGAYSMCTEDVAATGASQVMSFTNDDWCTNIATALIPSGGGATITYPQLERGIRGLARGVAGGIARSFVRRDRIFVPSYAVLGDLKAAA